MEKMNIYSFFKKIKDKILFSFKSYNFDSLQLSLLEETFNNYQTQIETNLFSTSSSIFYFIVKNYQKDFNEQSILLGSFFTSYVLALGLFDDVQDNDLAGKPYEEVGVPIAVNNALTLLFLSFKFLSQAVDLEKDYRKKSEYLKVFNTATLLAVKGQHKDLMGIKSTATTKDVLDMQKEKSASISMIAQCAAIFSDCNEEQIKKYRDIAEQMILIFQIVDDLRDIYGKKISPDLATDKVTYPIACFFENSSQDKIDKFNELKKNLPNSLKDIRELLYQSGSLIKSSETIENLRRNIHKDLASMNANSPSIRTLLYTIDAFASTIYKIPFLDESKSIFQPQGEWYSNINNTVDLFFNNMEKFNPPKKPVVLPWHLPQWLYDFKRNIIFYSDLEGQAEEILPLHSKLMGNSDLYSVKKDLELQAPFLMSHELFHYWRKQSGKLTKDYWYEEWVANSLAISYMQTFLPDLMINTKVFLEHILSNKNFKLSSKGHEILELYLSPDYKPKLSAVSYEVALEEIAYIEVSMAYKLLDQDHYLDELVKKFL